MSSHKMGARSGADGNMRLLSQYGGHRSGRRAYADGGAVNPSLDEGLAAAGDSDMKPMKGDKGEKKASKTNINIIVNGGKEPAPTGAAGMAPPAPMPMPPPSPMPPAPPMAGPMGGPPGPMGPGGPGLPMRASGGRVMKGKHDDEAKDKAMVKSAVGKHEKSMHPGKPMTRLSVGGPAKAPTEKGMLSQKGMQGGGGGAIGRLEKAKTYGK